VPSRPPLERLASGFVRRPYPVTATGSRRILTGFPQDLAALDDVDVRRVFPPASGCTVGGSPSIQ